MNHGQNAVVSETGFSTYVDMKRINTKSVEPAS